LAARVDRLLVVVGSRPRDEGEYFPLLGGGDRASLALRDSEVRAIRAALASGKPTVVVWVGGGLPALGSWYTRVPCLLLAGHGGMQGGRALADVLFGQAVAGGHTYACVPHVDDDLAPFDPRADEATYDRWFDYRRYDRAGRRPPLFLGHGSAQTTLRVSGARVARRSVGADDTVDVTLTLHNDGARDATPLVTLFVGAAAGSGREPWTLRGFSKVALAAGASAPLQLCAQVARLRQWDEREGTWHLPAGPRPLSLSVAGAERVALGAVVVRA
jgi:beta-glucosidase